VLLLSVSPLIQAQSGAKDGNSPDTNLPEKNSHGGNAQDTTSDRSLFEVIWRDGTVHTAICAGQSDWVIALLPRDIDRKGLRPPHVRTGNRKFGTEILHISDFYRLCLLRFRKAPDHTEPIPIPESFSQAEGIFLRSLATGTLYRGRVAGKDIEYQGEWLPCPLLRVRLGREGHSFCKPGTPLVDESGHMVGILTDRMLNARGETHAIPGSVIRKILWEMKHLEKSGPVWIGFSCHPQSTTPEVMRVHDESPAAQGGLQPGDVIVSVNGNRVETFRDLLGAIHCLPAARVARLRVLRDIHELEIELEPRLAEDRLTTRVLNHP